MQIGYERGNRHRDAAQLAQDKCGPEHRHFGSDRVGLPLAQDGFQILHLIRNRFDHPLTQQLGESEAARGLRGIAVGREEKPVDMRLIELRERKQPVAFAFQHFRGIGAAIERHLMAARTQRVGDRNLGIEVAGRMPRGYKKSSHVNSNATRASPSP